MKKEYIILVIVIVAMSLYLAFRKTDKTHYELPVQPKVAVKEINRIEVTGKDGSYELNKKDNSWYVTSKEYLVDPEKVNSMLYVIGDINLTALVSESKNYISFGLNDENKITVKAWKDDTLKREVDIGKIASSYSHTFVKFPGDPGVYHAQGNFKSKFTQSVDDLRDKNVLEFDENEIDAFQITKDKKDMMFTRKEVQVEEEIKDDAGKEPPLPESAKPVWMNADGKKAKDAEIIGLISTLSRLRCDKYIEGSTKEDFKDPVCTVRLKGSKDYSISIFPKADKDATKYTAVTSENDYPFLIPEWKANKILKEPEEMLEKETTDKKE